MHNDSITLFICKNLIYIKEGEAFSLHLFACFYNQVAPIMIKSMKSTTNRANPLPATPQPPLKLSLHPQLSLDIPFPPFRIINVATSTYFKMEFFSK